MDPINIPPMLAYIPAPSILWEPYFIPYPICSMYGMVLVYLPTKLGDLLINNVIEFNIHIFFSCLKSMLFPPRAKIAPMPRAPPATEAPVRNFLAPPGVSTT